MEFKERDEAIVLIWPEKLATKVYCKLHSNKAGPCCILNLVEHDAYLLDLTPLW